MNLKLVGEFYRLIHNSKCNFYKFIFDLCKKGGLHEKRKFIRVLSMVVLLLLVFTSCAKADRDSSYNNSSKYDDAGERGVAQEQKSSGSSLGAPMGSLDGDLDYADDSGTDTSSLNNSNQNTQDKIIKYVDMDVETLDFDELVSNINQQIKSLNGYVEKSRITGNSYYDSHSRRFAEIIARILRII